MSLSVLFVDSVTFNLFYQCIYVCTGLGYKDEQEMDSTSKTTYLKKYKKN